MNQLLFQPLDLAVARRCRKHTECVVPGPSSFSVTPSNYKYSIAAVHWKQPQHCTAGHWTSPLEQPAYMLTPGQLFEQATQVFPECWNIFLKITSFLSDLIEMQPDFHLSAPNIVHTGEKWPKERSHNVILLLMRGCFPHVAKEDRNSDKQESRCGAKANCMNNHQSPVCTLYLAFEFARWSLCDRFLFTASLQTHMHRLRIGSLPRDWKRQIIFAWVI